MPWCILGKVGGAKLGVILVTQEGVGNPFSLPFVTRSLNPRLIRNISKREIAGILNWVQSGNVVWRNYDGQRNGMVFRAREIEK